MPIGAAGLSAILAYDLRVNRLNNPEVIEGSYPVFSWKLKAANKDAKGLKQGVFEIIVCSTQKKATEGKGDLWWQETASNQTMDLPYDGKPLEPGKKYFWRLKVKDKASSTADWSAIQSFRVGVSNFKGQWIHGGKPQPVTSALDSAEWIWDQDGGPNAASGTKTFTYEFDGGTSARFVGSVDDEFELFLNGKKLGEQKGKDSWRQVTKIELKGIQKGKNRLEIRATNAAGQAGLLGAIEVQTADGKKVYRTGSEWKVEGRSAKVLGKNGMQPWNRIQETRFIVSPAKYFKKSWTPKSKVSSAVWYGTACGIADFTLNGKRISEDLFTPGWTDYRTRIYYKAYDLTNSIKKGENDLGATLGQGWYSGYVAWGAQREHYGDTPMVRGFLEVEYSDGSKETVATDSSWQVAEGPILDEHFLHGEKFDARKPVSGWKSAQIGNPKVGKFEAFEGNPVSEYQSLEAKTIKDLGQGKYLIDFGQNLSGYVRLKGKFGNGQKMTIRHGERLDASGQLYTDNLRLAQAIDSYIANGKGEETWNPRFTFHGFQYIEVSGMTEAPKNDTFKAVAISSATPETGKLETSDPMLNKLVSNAWWTQKMNFVDIPTDCPQRDERLGWTGDAQAYVRTATYFSDVHAFFTKWLVTLDDAQRADGQYPQVAPVLKGLEDGGPAWADAGVICPMTIYNVYGDRALLARHYPQMKKFIEFCRSRSKDNLMPPDKYHIFGDWLSINANTPNDLITTAYFAQSTLLVKKAAEILGEQKDVKYFDDLHKKIKQTYIENFLEADGKVKGDTQCGYVLTLGFDLVPKERQFEVVQHLVKNIEQRNWHLSTGFVGTRDLMNVLVKVDREDVAFRLLHNTTFPSWGFTVVNGATSIWERWDGWTPEKGFQDIGMNSFAHYAYGAVTGWMFETIGGIREAEAGYGKFVIEPKIDPNLTFANCSYESVRGTIRCNWKKVGNKVKFEIEVPPNTTAMFRYPSFKNAATAQSYGSGTYTFTVDIPGTTNSK